MARPRRRASLAHALVRATAAGPVLVMLAMPAGARALPPTTVKQITRTPAVSVPASARVQPATGGTVVSPTGTTTAPATATTTPQSSATQTGIAATHPTSPSPTHSSASSKLSTPAIALAAIAALLALGCAIWGIARLQAFEPHWTLSLRHTLAEAGFRASATWAEFSDWARLGR